MIRRSDLAPSQWHVTGVSNVAKRAAEVVKAGESVRITGLGTLQQWDTRDAATDTVTSAYRLTLTAAVWQATSKANGVDAPGTDIRRDVTHLARALGAPVEVWAPHVAPRGVTGYTPAEKAIGTLVTTVSP